ncbi:uncharacterized protein LOC135491160 [Lineus longissimus]|uniref:uncharacterized protein LOC135491160 n=1 Tax=Lineus longissimus TaxID=88925 RepID=UPI002B4DF0B9
MKLFLVLLAAAAAVAASSLQRTNHQERENDGNELSAQGQGHDELVNRYRRAPTPAPDQAPFMKDTFLRKHVARAGEMGISGRVGSTPWKNSMAGFALNKAKDGYRSANPQARLRDILPESYTIIQMRDKNDYKVLREDFESRSGDRFVTDHIFKVHEFERKQDGRSYDYKKTDQVNLDLGVSNGEVNHFAGTVKCRNNGRRQGRRRHQRSVFRLNGQLCMRSWVNPSPPESSVSARNRGTDDSSTGSRPGGTGTGTQTRPVRCLRGYRRVAGRCRRIPRRRQQG